jgi:hypothetical protein
MKDAGDEKDRFVVRDHHKREIEVEGGQGEAGPYLVLVLQVKRERNIGEAVAGRKKVFEFQTVCCSGSQLHIIIGANLGGAGRRSSIRRNRLW